MEIPVDYKICKKREASDCVKAGPQTMFDGRVCKKCNAIYKAQYYQKHKKEINERWIAKWRVKRDSQKQNSE